MLRLKNGAKLLFFFESTKKMLKNFAVLNIFTIFAPNLNWLTNL